MNTSERTDSREKGSSPASSILTPPDSALSTSPPSIHTSLSQPAQRALQIVKSVKHGRRPDSSWVKLRLEPGDFFLLEERLKAEDLWGYAEDKIRFDYSPRTYDLIFRMPTCLHEIFTRRVTKEIERQLERLCMDTSRPDVSTLARSIICCGSSDIHFPSDPDQDHSRHSPDEAFCHIGARYSSLIIETSFSQKRRDLPRLADDYVIGSYGNIKMVIGLDIEYRNTKGATVSIWESKKGIEEDGVPYLCAEKTVDNKPFRNDDSSLVEPNIALVIPLSIFMLPSDAPLLLSPDAVISIPYTTLYSFLEDAESVHHEMHGKDAGGFMVQPLPGTRLRRRQMTPEEQLEDDDEARFVASEEEVEEMAFEEDGAYEDSR